MKNWTSFLQEARPFDHRPGFCQSLGAGYVSEREQADAINLTRDRVWRSWASGAAFDITIRWTSAKSKPFLLKIQNGSLVAFRPGRMPKGLESWRREARPSTELALGQWNCGDF